MLWKTNLNTTAYLLLFTNSEYYPNMLPLKCRLPFGKFKWIFKKREKRNIYGFPSHLLTFPLPFVFFKKQNLDTVLCSTSTFPGAFILRRECDISNSGISNSKWKTVTEAKKDSQRIWSPGLSSSGGKKTLQNIRTSYL